MNAMQATRSWWLTHALVPALLCAGLAAAIGFGGWDRICADAFYDAASQRWLLDGAAGVALHESERLLAGAFAVTALLLMSLRRWRRPASYLLLCFALTTSLVSLGKHTTGVDCPRD